jgi:PadR family transcriptional regulator PadR
MRGYNEALVLSILKDGDNYGYMISKEIAARCNEKYVVKEATLYAVLLRLEKKNFVTSYKGEVTRGKERTYFRITNEGMIYLKEKCDEWMVTKFVVDAILMGDDIGGLLY